MDSPNSGVRALEVAPRISLTAGAEPLPGYRLIGPIGSGGFGEVWKCEAPGGFFKAVKFVHGNLNHIDNNAAARQEMEALSRVKAVRHPFVLSIDRVEIVGGELIIVMELADKNFLELQSEYQAAGQAGIPRDELLSLLLEAAEALDLMNFEHSLQHLDVKPANLFVLGGHAKVADFGLVYSIEGVGPDDALHRSGGITPLYAAPELLQGSLSRHSDQYSLAVVYQELLTGTHPFRGKNVRHLLLQQMSGEPNLFALPDADRALVSRALTVDPKQRFPSCLDFVQALVYGRDSAPTSPHRTTRHRIPIPARRPAAPAKDELAPPTDEIRTNPIRKPTSRDEARATPLDPSLSCPLSPTVPGPAAVVTETPVSSPAAGDPLPGYKLLECLGQAVHREVWKVQADGGPVRLAQFLCGPAGNGNTATSCLLARLREISHPHVPPADVYWSRCGRLVVITDLFSRTLRDRFMDATAHGNPGLPRSELLAYLTTAAEALDALNQEHGLQHLALNPHNLLLDGGRLRVAEFGLAQLVWMPGGHSPTQFNGRYAAPELLEGRSSRSSDQYSLALIYAEMLTGVAPRTQRPAARSHPARKMSKMDFDLLPAPDREVIVRALDADPARRFSSCSAMVRALRDATVRDPAAEAERYEALPSIVPFACLFEGDLVPDASVPPRDQLVAELIAAGTGALDVCDHANFRYLRHPNDLLTHHFRLRLLPQPMLKLKFQRFRQRWTARLVQEENETFVFQIDAPLTVWQRWAGRQHGIEVQVQFCPPERIEEPGVVHVRVRNFGPGGAKQTQQLREQGPVLIESLRAALEAPGEQRLHERWPCVQPLHLYPVGPDLRPAAAVAGMGHDISLSGISFVVQQSLPGEYLFVHLPATAALTPFVLLAKIVRVEPRGEGGYLVGATFPHAGRLP